MGIGVVASMVANFPAGKVTSVYVNCHCSNCSALYFCVLPKWDLLAMT